MKRDPYYEGGERHVRHGIPWRIPNPPMDIDDLTWNNLKSKGSK